MSLFGDMFDDEDEGCSLSTFTAGGGGNKQPGRVARPYFFDRRSQTGFVGLLNQYVYTTVPISIYLVNILV